MTSTIVWLLPALFAGAVWPHKVTETAKPVPVVQTTVVEVKTPDKVPQTVEEMIISTFGNKAMQATKVARCESGLNPQAKNKHSTATGLFQIIRSTWEANTNESWNKATDPSTNIMVAKKLYDNRKFTPWKASESCWKRT